MANYATLKAAIQQVVKTNGANEITGALLQQSLLAMIDSLGNGYMYAGLATPSTNPGTPDQNVFYIASTAGTYSNFGSLVLSAGEVAILRYNGSWAKDTTGFATTGLVSVSNNNLMISGDKSGVTTPDVFNVNVYNAAMSTDYTLTTARNATPTAIRKPGIILTFLSGGVWVFWHFIGTSASTWTTAANWVKIHIDSPFMIVPFTTNVATTRASVASTDRQLGKILAYNNGSKWVIEQYIGPDVTYNNWVENANWRAIADESFVLNYSAVYNVTAMNSNTNYTSAADARNAVSEGRRKRGLILTYLLNNVWVTEQFIGTSVAYGWASLESNWNQFVSLAQVNAAIIQYSGILNVTALNGNTDYETKSAARSFVGESSRKRGLILTYLLNGVWIVEQFIGTSVATGWASVNSNWKTLHDDSLTISDLSAITKLTVESTANYYINIHGQKVSQTGFAYQVSTPIALTEGQTLIVKTTAAKTYAVISKTDENGTSYEPIVFGISNVQETYIYKATENCYVALSFAYSCLAYIEAKNGIYGQLETGAWHIEKIRPKWTIGRYFYNAGGFQEFGNIDSTYWHKTNFYDVRNCYGIVCNLNGITATAHRLYLFDANGNYIETQGRLQTQFYKINAAFVCFDINTSTNYTLDQLDQMDVFVVSRPLAGRAKPIKIPNLISTGATRRVAFTYKKVTGGNKNVSATDVSTPVKYSNDYLFSHGIITLPTRYSHDGPATRLIWFCNGSGNPNPINWGSDPDYTPFVEYLVKEGYAVADAACWGASDYKDGSIPSYNHWCTPTNIATMYGFYSYLMENYNLLPEIFVFAKSQGGLKAMDLEFSTIPVKAVCLLAARTSPLQAIYGYSDKERSICLQDLGFDNIQLDSNNKLIGDAAVLSHDYANDNIWDDARKTYWLNNIQLVKGTDPLFKGLLNLEYEEYFYRVYGSYWNTTWKAANPKAKYRTPFLVSGALDDTIYWESLMAFVEADNQLNYCRQINMPSGNQTPHHAVDTTGPTITVTTKFGETITGVPLAWAEMLDFFKHYE